MAHAWFNPIVTVVILASVVIWLFVLAQWSQRRPVLAYRPRRPAPWDGGTIVLMIVIHLALFSVAASAIHYFLPADAATPNEAADASTIHVIEKMAIASHHNPWIFLVAAIAAVAVAPIIEEFFFRVLLQGWLESLQRRHRHWAWCCWRPLPGALPIATSALLFAAMHFHVAHTAPPPLVIAAGLIADAASKLTAMAAVVVLLRVQRGATAADFGWTLKGLLPDVGLGLLTYVAVIPAVYLLQFLVQQIMPSSVAPDPVPLFFLALVLGTVYYRTHRILPVIVTHAAFNATTLLVLWLQS